MFLRMHPLGEQPTRLGRLKLFVVYAIYTVIGMSADALRALLLAMHIISPERPASDYRVRICDLVTD